MTLSEHNPFGAFGAFGVVDPAIATERAGLDFLKSMLERRAPSPPFSETKTVFVRAAHERTGLLRCEGTLLHSGKRIASSEGKVFDREGQLIAYGSETCLIADLGSRV